jgi:hypothetical protein
MATMTFGDLEVESFPGKFTGQILCRFSKTEDAILEGP